MKYHLPDPSDDGWNNFDHLCFNIFSWISFELSYDRYNAGYENIYRIVAEDEGSNSVSVSPAVKTGKLFIDFATLSTLISMLGLFGLSAYTALKLPGENGIRKVFGALGYSILRMFSGEFARLVLFSFVISAPLAWIFINMWLVGFAYKVRINPVLMLMTGRLVMVLTLLTIGFHSIRAAHTNPVTT